MRYELALFEADEAGGIRLVGRSIDPVLISNAHARILAERRAEVARLESDTSGPHLRAVAPPEESRS